MVNLNKNNTKPIVIVGAGISGIVIAEQISSKLDIPIIILEKRNHIGGNCFDDYSKEGLLVHKYGPHIFHTDNENVWNYLSNFTQWKNIEIKVKALINKKLISIPINRNTLKDLYDKDFSKEEMQSYLLQFKRQDISNAEELIISKVGEDIYNKVYKNYIHKQWDKETKELDISVLNRLPIRFNNDERYFTDKYQGLPLDGYTAMFEKMLVNKNITIMLKTDYKKVISKIDYCHLIYTGAIDYFYNYKYGQLEYRGLEFRETTYNNKEFHLKNSIISYPNDYKYTRAVEYKQLTGQKNSNTIVVREYPIWNSTEYYPVLTKKNHIILAKYTDEKEKEINITFIGRLAEYKYYNMDQVVEKAINVSNCIVEKYGFNHGN